MFVCIGEVDVSAHPVGLTPPTLECVGDQNIAIEDYYLLVGVVFVCQAKTIASSGLRRPPRAPLPANGWRHAAGMLARGAQALEP